MAHFYHYISDTYLNKFSTLIFVPVYKTPYSNSIDQSCENLYETDISLNVEESYEETSTMELPGSQENLKAGKEMEDKDVKWIFSDIKRIEENQTLCIQNISDKIEAAMNIMRDQGAHNRELIQQIDRNMDLRISDDRKWLIFIFSAFLIFLFGIPQVIKYLSS